MSNKNLITQEESTKQTLRKATDIINRTNKILKNSKKELVANPDVMIIDGKMWQKETVEEEMYWDKAMEYAKNLRLGGYDDWRLPTIEELKDVVRSCGGIPIRREDNMGRRPQTDKFYENLEKLNFSVSMFDHYLSSTIGIAVDTDSHLIMDFYSAYCCDYAFYVSGQVRCLREI